MGGGGPAKTGVAGGVGCGVGLTTTTRGNIPTAVGGVDGAGRSMLGIGATGIAPGSAATMTGSGLTSTDGCLAEARSSLSGIISHMILPTEGGFGFERLLKGRG